MRWLWRLIAGAAARAVIARVEQERDVALARAAVAEAQNLEWAKVHGRTIARLDAESAEFVARRAVLTEAKR